MKFVFKKYLLVIYFIIIALLVIFLLYKINLSKYTYHFQENFTDEKIFSNTQGDNTLAVDSGLTMKVKVENTFGPKIDPNPNERYSASIDTFGAPAVMSGNNTAVLPYYISKQVLDLSNISLTVQPLTGRTPVNTDHYEDAFPRMFQLDVFVDFSSVPFRLDNYNKSTTVSVDSNGVLNAGKISTILDYSSNQIGFVKKDIYDPNHYFVTITTPTTAIKKVVFTWTLSDLCLNTLDNGFSGNCKNNGKNGNCVPYSFNNFYNNFPGYSYLGNIFSGNIYSGNIFSGNVTFGNCSPGSPSALCSGTYKVSPIK
jgi:hypothetical protein